MSEVHQPQDLLRLDARTLQAVLLTPAQIDRLLELTPAWQRDGDAIVRSFAFTDFHHTMAFVNAVAWIAHEQDHHPDLAVGYNRCAVRWNTHSVGGLSIKDFICAARVNALQTPDSI